LTLYWPRGSTERGARIELMRTTSLAPVAIERGAA
jgi:hypothetical protein